MAARLKFLRGALARCLGTGDEHAHRSAPAIEEGSARLVADRLAGGDPESLGIPAVALDGDAVLEAPVRRQYHADFIK